MIVLCNQEMCEEGGMERKEKWGEVRSGISYK